MSGSWLDALAMRSFACGVGSVVSSFASSSSYSFSPGRRPLKVIGISCSVWPDSRISMLARSTIFTGSPMSSTKIWPERPIRPACSTSWAASGMVMK